MGSNIFSSDDDIFDDSTTLADISSKSSSSSEGSSKPSSKHVDMAIESVVDLLNQIIQHEEIDVEEVNKLVDHIKTEHGIDLRSFTAGFRIKLAATILDGAGSWVNKFQEFDIPRSVVYALDVLTENKFSMLNKFFNIELENAKRIVISNFLESTFLSENDNVGKAVFAKALDINFDSRYVNTFYASLYEINNFTIAQNNGVYAASGEELSLPLNQDIIDGKEVDLDLLSANRYTNTKFSSCLGNDLRVRIAQKVADSTDVFMKGLRKNESKD